MSSNIEVKFGDMAFMPSVFYSLEELVREVGGASQYTDITVTATKRNGDVDTWRTAPKLTPITIELTAEEVEMARRWSDSVYPVLVKIAAAAEAPR